MSTKHKIALSQEVLSYLVDEVGQTNKTQPNRQTNRQRDIQTDRETYRQTERQAERYNPRFGLLKSPV